MIRNLKALGVAAIAALAMSAVVASAANAEFTSAGYPATATAESTDDVFTAFGSDVKCTENTFTGSLGGPSNDLTITPTYQNCTFGSFPATVDFTSCDYEFHASPVSVDVKCAEPGDTIDITVFASHNAHTAGTAICHVFVPEQTGLTGISYTNNANGTVTVDGEVGGIEATQQRNSFVCPAGTETSSAVYDIQEGGIEVSGDNGAVEVH